jgi:hypothetical protein
MFPKVRIILRKSANSKMIIKVICPRLRLGNFFGLLKFLRSGLFIRRDNKMQKKIDTIKEIWLIGIPK